MSSIDRYVYNHTMKHPDKRQQKIGYYKTVNDTLSFVKVYVLQALKSAFPLALFWCTAIKVPVLESAVFTKSLELT